MAGQSQEHCARLRVDPKVGLSDSEVMSRLVIEGGNLFSSPPRLPLYYRILVFAVNNVNFLMQMVLLLSMIRPINPEGNVSRLLHILLCLFLMGPLFYKTYTKKKEEIMESVEVLDNVRALRKGIVTFVDTAHLVRGDIVFLGTDTFVPADICVITAESLYIDPAPIDPTQEVFRAKKDQVLLRGCKVVCGIANAIVIEVGDATFEGKRRQQIFNEQNSLHRFSLSESLLFLMTLSVVGSGIAIAYFQTHWEPFKHLVVAAFIIVRFHEDYYSASNVVDAITKRQIEGTGLAIVSYPAVKLLRSVSHVCVNLDDFVKKKRKQVSRMYVGGKVVGRKELRPGDAHELAECSVLGTNATFEVNPAIKERRVIGSPEEAALLFFADTQVDLTPLQSQRRSYQRYEGGNYQLCIRTREEADIDFAHRLVCVGSCDYILGHTSYEVIAEKKQPIDKKRIETVMEQLKQSGYSLVAVGYLDLSTKDFGLNYQFTESNVPMSDWILAGIFALNEELLESFGSSLEDLRDSGFRVTAFTAGNYRDTLAYFKQLNLIPSSDATEETLKTDQFTILNGERVPMQDLIAQCSNVPVAVVCHLRMNDRFDLVTALTENAQALGFMSGSVNDIPPMRAASFSVAIETEEELLHANSNFKLGSPDPSTMIQLKKICVTEPLRRFSTLQHLWGLFFSQLAIFGLALLVQRFDPSQVTAMFLEIGALNAPCYTFGPLARTWGLESGLTSMLAGCYAFFTVLADFGIPFTGLHEADLSVFGTVEGNRFTTCYYEESGVCYREDAFTHAQTAFFISVAASQWAMYLLMQIEDYFRKRQSLHWGTIHITYFFKLVFLLLLAFIPRMNAILKLTPIHFEHFAFPGAMFAAMVYGFHLLFAKTWEILRG